MPTDGSIDRGRDQGTCRGEKRGTDEAPRTAAENAQAIINRHSRAGGNPAAMGVVLPAIVGRVTQLDSRLRGNDGNVKNGGEMNAEDILPVSSSTPKRARPRISR